MTVNDAGSSTLGVAGTRTSFQGGVDIGNCWLDFWSPVRMCRLQSWVHHDPHCPWKSRLTHDGQERLSFEQHFPGFSLNLSLSLSLVPMKKWRLAKPPKRWMIAKSAFQLIFSTDSFPFVCAHREATIFHRRPLSIQQLWHIFFSMDVWQHNYILVKSS